MALVLFLALQDDIADWVAKLADASIETREQAQRELVKIGEKALPALEKIRDTNDPDLRSRVETTIWKIRARVRALKLGLDRLIPADLQAKMPDLLERAGSESFEDRRQLFDDLQASVEGGVLREKDLLWVGALLKGGANASLRTVVYLQARKWWYESTDDEVSAAGGKILAEMGEEFLRDWVKVLARIADSPADITLFDCDLINSTRGGTEEGQLSAAAIAELVELGGVEIVPILVDIATDYNADVSARKAALSGVSALRKKWKK